MPEVQTLVDTEKRLPPVANVGTLVEPTTRAQFSDARQNAAQLFSTRIKGRMATLWGVPPKPGWVVASLSLTSV